MNNKSEILVVDDDSAHRTMLRLGGTEVPLWQIITSLGLLGLSVLGGLILSIKIFRMNMLMHGKRPSIREVIQGLKET